MCLYLVFKSGVISLSLQKSLSSLPFDNLNHLSFPTDESQAAAMSSVKSVFSRKAVVRMQLLKEVVGSDSYRVNNKYDHNHTPLPVCEIIQRAQVLIGQEVSYDLLGSNCEHFVTLLRYGEGVSEQVSHCLFCFCLVCH